MFGRNKCRSSFAKTVGVVSYCSSVLLPVLSLVLFSVVEPVLVFQKKKEFTSFDLHIVCVALCDFVDAGRQRAEHKCSGESGCD